MADDHERKPCGCHGRYYSGIGWDWDRCPKHRIPCAHPVGRFDLCRLPRDHRGEHDGAFANAALNAPEVAP